jgi:histone-lysine N-methyltransferase SETMAR
VNKEIYIDILRRLRDSVKRKCPEKLRTNIWFSIHDDAPAHRSVSVEDFLAKSNVTTLEHTPYSIDLDPTEYYLFPRLISALKGRNYRDATDIIKNTTEELKILSQNGFQERLKYLYSFWQKNNRCTRRPF